MNTERVKNILIVLLSLTAATLVALIILEENRFRLSGAQESAIIDLLARNDIHFSAAMIGSARPMHQLRLSPYNHDGNIDALKARFFGGSIDYVRRYVEDNVDIYATDSKEMLFFRQENVIVFEIPDGLTSEAFEGNFGASAAQALAEHYINQIMGMPPCMELFDISFNRDHAYVISFFSTYRGHILHNDHIRVTVTSRGITHIFYSRIVNDSFIGEERSIFSGDEALLALLNHLRHNLQIEGRIGIGGMYMAYFMTNNGIGVPVYVFTITLGNDLRFNHIFNAQTNEHIWWERLW